MVVIFLLVRHSFRLRWMNMWIECSFDDWLNDTRMKWYASMKKAFSKLIYCTLTWWTRDAIKFGVGGRVHFLPFSQLAVTSNEFTCCDMIEFISHTIDFIYTMTERQWRRFIDIYDIWFNQHQTKLCCIKKWFTWSFLSALESRHRVGFSILTYSLASLLPLALFFESVNLTWPFDFSESCLSLVLLSVASWFYYGESISKTIRILSWTGENQR